MSQLKRWVGIGSGVCTSISLEPRLYKIIKTKKVENISTFLLAILITGLAGCVRNSILKKDWLIIFTSALAILINLLTIVFSVKYKFQK